MSKKTPKTKRKISVSQIEFSGLPSLTAIQAPIMGETDPVTINGNPLVLDLHPHGSHEMQIFHRVVGLSKGPEEPGPDATLEELETVALANIQRDMELLPLLVKGWNIEGLEYARDHLADLMTTYPEVVEPIRSGVTGALVAAAIEHTAPPENPQA